MWRRGRGANQPVTHYHVVLSEAASEATESSPTAGIMTSPPSPWRYPAPLRFFSLRHYHRDAPGLDCILTPREATKAPRLGPTSLTSTHIVDCRIGQAVTEVTVQPEGFGFDPLVSQDSLSKIFNPSLLKRPLHPRGHGEIFHPQTE